MAKIGTLGSIAFEVSTFKTLTFNDLTRSAEARVATHEIIGQKPKLEFLGPGLEELNFTIYLNTFLGVDIEKTMAELREMRDTGRLEYFIINGKPVTDNKWLLVSLSENVRATNGTGKTIKLEASLTLREYDGGSSAERSAAASERNIYTSST